MQKAKKKILVVFGTRPEAIKLAFIIKVLKQDKAFKVMVCITSQHREMLRQVLDSFDIRPNYDLEIMRKNQSLHHIIINTLGRMQKVLQKVKPDLIIVQGDTTTAFATALSAFYAKIPLAHIEAGLRTKNKYAPFPEEVNRVLISHIGDLHFAPTNSAASNLIEEGIPKNKIFVTGNTGIDTLLFVSKKAEKLRPKILENIRHKKIILVTGHRRESFGEPFKNICFALKNIAEKNSDLEIIYPVHLNPNVRRPVFRILGKCRNISLLKPLDYLTFVWLMNKSYLILTDSGGVQEEAPSLGKPVLVMREVTERPEGIRAGTAKLVGTNVERIVQATKELLRNRLIYEKMSKAVNPYGDGRASYRIVKIIKKYIK